MYGTLFSNIKAIFPTKKSTSVKELMHSSTAKRDGTQKDVALYASFVPRPLGYVERMYTETEQRPRVWTKKGATVSGTLVCVCRIHYKKMVDCWETPANDLSECRFTKNNARPIFSKHIGYPHLCPTTVVVVVVTYHTTNQRHG